MASLKVISDRCTDNALTVTVRIPARRNGDANLSCLTRVVADLHAINPDAFDPVLVVPADTNLDDLLNAHPGGVIRCGEVMPDPAVVAAIRRDLIKDDDEGAPGEPPRCKTGGCD
jgi:hypothetical protein